MGETRSQFGYGKLFASTLIVCMVLFAVGCAELYEPVPHKPGDTNSAALVKPSSSLTQLVQGTGSAFGPVDKVSAAAIVLALQAGALFLNKRAIKQTMAEHAEEFHATTIPPPRPLS